MLSKIDCIQANLPLTFRDLSQQYKWRPLASPLLFSPPSFSHTIRGLEACLSKLCLVLPKVSTCLPCAHRLHIYLLEDRSWEEALNTEEVQALEADMKPYEWGILGIQIPRAWSKGGYELWTACLFAYGLLTRKKRAWSKVSQIMALCMFNNY